MYTYAFCRAVSLFSVRIDVSILQKAIVLVRQVAYNYGSTSYCFYGSAVAEIVYRYGRHPRCGQSPQVHVCFRVYIVTE